MTDITHIFGGPISSEKRVEPVEVQIKSAMLNAGLQPPKDLKLDGRLHRFATAGKKKNDNGWYVFFSDGIPAGKFGCWREGIEGKFIADVGRELTAAERMAHTRRMAEAQAIRDAEKSKRNEVAADTVSAIWESAGAASPDHPYLKRKGINPHGVRITGDGRLIAPLYSPDGDLMSLQYISEGGDKLYHAGGATKGGSWSIGDPGGTIFIAEGFATAATIHEETGECCIIAYSASNIVPVAQSIREQYGTMQEVVIVADNDESGTGRNYADQAAAKMGARVVMPNVPGDANDYKLAGHDLNALLYPPVEEWLIQADSFASKPAPLKWIVKGWWQQHALMMVHGPSGAGKTFVVLDMAAHVAAGLDQWHECNVTPGTVIYLAGEGHYGLRGRIAAWKQHNAVDKLDMFISRAGCDLNTPEGYNKVVQAVRALPTPPALIVVDTLHRFLNGDENSAQDAKTMLDACNALMDEFNCSVLLVHHTGVSEEAQHRARGSSAWRGALDIEISVIPPKAAGSITVAQRKSKDTELKEADGEAVGSAVIVPGIQPEKPAPKYLAKKRQIFEKMWAASGRDVDQDLPYISESGAAVGLESLKYASASIKKYAKANGGPLRDLLDAELIQVYADGYRVCDLVWAASLMLQKETPD